MLLIDWRKYLKSIFRIADGGTFVLSSGIDFSKIEMKFQGQQSMEEYPFHPIQFFAETSPCSFIAPRSDSPKAIVHAQLAAQSQFLGIGWIRYQIIEFKRTVLVKS